MLKTETYFSILPVLMFLVVLGSAAIEHEHGQEQEQDLLHGGMTTEIKPALAESHYNC